MGGGEGVVGGWEGGCGRVGCMWEGVCGRVGSLGRL